jgi:thiamine monophosphate kinase
MGPTALAFYGRLCGQTLARAHARSGDRIAIAGYLGGSDAFDASIADYSMEYAAQNARDHDALQAAANDGRVRVREGI